MKVYAEIDGWRKLVDVSYTEAAMGCMTMRILPPVDLLLKPCTGLVPKPACGVELRLYYRGRQKEGVVVFEYES